MIYINGMGCISAQDTFTTDFLQNVVINTTAVTLPAITPDFKEFIAPAAARRMAKGVKNGIAASAKALQEAGVAMPGAIITGTGMGCNIDSEKFLKAVIDNTEEHLTPTSFIQSTHNTVGGQIALNLGCKAYNFTYVSGAVSFESCLLDAMMQLQEQEADDILIGGVDELAEFTTKFQQLSGVLKNAADAPFAVLESETPGAVLSEGAVFFVLSGKKQQSTYAQVTDVAMYNILGQDEIGKELEEFLQKNDLDSNNIDAIVLGYNGDIQYDRYYSSLAEDIFPATAQLYYKHLSGEYNTASAFGLWIAANILKIQSTPDVLAANAIKPAQYKNILLYNQYRGKDHSFTLVSVC